jgi:hypothetical protein
LGNNSIYRDIPFIHNVSFVIVVVQIGPDAFELLVRAMVIAYPHVTGDLFQQWLINPLQSADSAAVAAQAAFLVQQWFGGGGGRR